MNKLTITTDYRKSEYSIAVKTKYNTFVQAINSFTGRTENRLMMDCVRGRDNQWYVLEDATCFDPYYSEREVMA